MHDNLNLKVGQYPGQQQST